MYVASWCVQDTFFSTMGGVLRFEGTAVKFTRTGNMLNPVTFNVPYNGIASAAYSRCACFPAVIVNMAEGGHYKFIVFRRKRFMRDIAARVKQKNS